MSYQDLKDCKMITAFITPFHEDGSINFEAIPPWIEHLLAHHTDGILLAGTTAESPTLTHDEELELFAAVQKVVNGRVPFIAGIGTNETRDSIEFVKEVDQFGGFAAGLAIVPYYNKPSQEGMYQHFKAIADASNLPIIIYNIPGRVVVEMTPETMLRLAEHPNIIGVKECTTLANMAYLIENLPNVKFYIAAPVMVAESITALLAYPNISVLSDIAGQPSLVESLIERCDFLLDINADFEVDGIIGRFQQAGKPVFAFESVAHGEQGQFLYDQSNPAEMVIAIEAFCQNEELPVKKLNPIRK